MCFVTIVASLGTCTRMYIATISGISREMLEVAKIDGATKVQTAWYIITPLVKPTTMYLTVTQVINMLKLFVIVQLLTDGGPNNASMTMMYYLYRSLRIVKCLLLKCENAIPTKKHFLKHIIVQQYPIVI